MLITHLLSTQLIRPQETQKRYMRRYFGVQYSVCYLIIVEGDGIFFLVFLVKVVKGLGETLVGAYPGRALSFVCKKNDLTSPQVTQLSFLPRPFHRGYV